jgi:hypothetical protein
MPHDRRQFLASAAMAGWAGTTEAAATNNSGGRVTGNGTPGAALPDLAFAQREPFLDRERASRILAAENLDALLVCQGRNVFHVTN